MHICLDYRPALHEATGVGTYVSGLLSGLLECHPEDRYTAFSASWKHRLGDVPDAGVVDVRVPVRILDALWHRCGWPAVERWTGDIDVAHSPSPLPIPTRRALRVVTVHDCYFLRFPEHVSGPMSRDYVPLVRDSVRAADAVVAVSETTRRELCELTGVDPKRVHVTYNGVGRTYRRSSADAAPETLERLGIKRPYLLFVGRREPRKNLGVLLEAFAQVAAARDDVDLLLVGPDGLGWDHTWSNVPGTVRRRVVLLPYQQASTLACLYAHSRALLLPSLWEGFGLTAVEAMACGAPVIAARAGALPEVLGDNALWIDPASPDEIARASHRVLDDDALRARLVEAGGRCAQRYSWRRTARLTHELYRRIVR